MPDIFVSPPQSTSSASHTRRLPSLSQAFSSYLFMPEGMRFETQAAGETIILLLRRHFITNLVWITISILLIIGPFFVFSALLTNGTNQTFIPGSFITLLILVWYLGTFSYIFVNFLLWYFNVSIVTNERVIDIDFVNVLHKEFSATLIAQIEDVTTRKGGFLRTVFDFGDVFVQTAGKQMEFEFLAVPHPERVVRVINNLMGKSEGGG